MRRIFLFLILCFFITGFLNAQNNDTIIVATDSGDVYIIRTAPVTLKRKIEIISERLKGHYYFSVSLGVLGSKPFYSVNDHVYNDYTNLLYQNTSGKAGFIQSIELIRAPRQFVWTMFFDWNHIVDEHTYFYGLYKGEKGKFEYNYFQYGLRAGYWFRKKKKQSFLPSIGISGSYLASNNGSVVTKELYLSQVTPDPTQPSILSSSLIKDEFKTKRIYPSVNINLKYLFRIKERIYIEACPFASFSLMNRMKKEEVFSEHRLIYGIKVGITQNIF